MKFLTYISDSSFFTCNTQYIIDKKLFELFNYDVGALTNEYDPNWDFVRTFKLGPDTCKFVANIQKGSASIGFYVNDSLNIRHLDKNASMLFSGIIKCLKDLLEHKKLTTISFASNKTKLIKLYDNKLFAKLLKDRFTFKLIKTGSEPMPKLHKDDAGKMVFWVYETAVFNEGWTWS